MESTHREPDFLREVVVVELGQTPDGSRVHAADALGPRVLSVVVDAEDDGQLERSEAEGGGHAGAGRERGGGGGP